MYGCNRLIGFWCRTLTKTKNCSHLENETLTLIFRATKFRDYLLCRSFILGTDHELLVGFFKEKQGYPKHDCSPNPEMGTRTGSVQVHYQVQSEIQVPYQLTGWGSWTKRCRWCLRIWNFNAGPVCRKQLEYLTSKGPDMQCLREAVLAGWAKKLTNSDLQPCWQRLTKLFLWWSPHSHMGKGSGA